MAKLLWRLVGADEGSSIFSYFPGSLSILYSKCRLDTLERSILHLPRSTRLLVNIRVHRLQRLSVVQCAAAASG